MNGDFVLGAMVYNRQNLIYFFAQSLTNPSSVRRNGSYIIALQPGS